MKSSSESSSEDEETEEQQLNIEFVTTVEASIQEVGDLIYLHFKKAECGNSTN